MANISAHVDKDARSGAESTLVPGHDSGNTNPASPSDTLPPSDPAEGTDGFALPSSHSPTLYLTHPTPAEQEWLCRRQHISWGNSLPEELYQVEAKYLKTVPLAANGGLTTWILTTRGQAPGDRLVLSSCESYRKRALLRRPSELLEVTVHGVASLLTPVEYRRRGYARRLMIELQAQLRTWQEDVFGSVVGAVLFSDIGLAYYIPLGWKPPEMGNVHVLLAPEKGEATVGSIVRDVLDADLEVLCAEDETRIRHALAKTSNSGRNRVAVVPDLDHMRWHFGKEDFAAKHIFGRRAESRGAIAGTVKGQRVWAVWTRRYYSHPDNGKGDNTLYILRLVIEADEESGEVSEKQSGYLKAMLQAAQAAASEWKLDSVELWDPSPAVMAMIREQGLAHEVVERQEEGMACWYWYGEAVGKPGPALDVLSNEHYAWV